MKKIYNTIYTAQEYMAQGFSVEEVPMVTRHDILFNKSVDGVITEKEKQEMFELIDLLGL